ncbi:haloacid dehalogenase type II [Sneathiella marina]|uniref:(S)-2-haloacid dehalogenase n=1 Tax=Sneathiella marina TaxID=2950108 RepID=A0ABY4W0E8_9PROT|nr:haloacid dehalogenase type II [Sneathiella marina]USG60665.1 haloacid dehalogenase type II [Sneathiella marina]
MIAASVKVLCFDVFGTVTDWYSSVTREGEALSRETGIELAWGEFVTRWRLEGYMAALQAISSGQMEITPTATIHKTKLLSLLAEYGVSGLTDAQIDHFNLAWNRLDVWSDAVEGLSLLKENYMIMPFSNGDYRCLLDISKRNRLPWDGIISADFFKKVKPDPTIYLDAASLLQLPPAEIMMVACHAQDLTAAKNAGFKTAYVNRLLEFGPNVPQEEKPIAFDYDVSDFIELDRVLRADR